MATFYSKFKSLELRYESKPIQGLTKQKWSDSLFLIRGKDEGIPAWHYILVPYEKLNVLQNHQSGQIIDCKKFGSVIEYRDNNGQICPASGWGINPTYSFQTWIENQYGDRPFDENIQFEYLKDDIRLCTIQRLTSDQLIGIYRYYNKQGNFHYIKLFDHLKESLAYRGGIRNYDRFISLNGINIEKNSLNEITKYFQNKLNLPLQLLVCNPSTYHYYKSNNLIIHSNLNTVQHLKPVFHISSTTNQNLKKFSNEINSNKKSVLEDLPNELFFDIFEYFKIEDFHHCFYNLNNRLTNLLLFQRNLSLIYDENLNLSLMKFYSNQIKYLTIDTFNQSDLTFFPNLSSLRIENRDLNHLKQIQPEIFPHLKSLSFLLKSDFEIPTELVNQIFSNQFVNLHLINFGLIRRSICKNWLISPSIRRISFHCNELMIIEDILLSCPNLISLQMNLLYNSNISMNSLELFNHKLEKLILTSEGFELTIDLMKIIFNLIPNIKYLYLQTKCQIPFIHFIQNIFKQLKYLIKFNCFIKEFLIENQRIGNLNEIHQISSCFQTIQCIKQNQLFRIFSTD